MNIIFAIEFVKKNGECFICQGELMGEIEMKFETNIRIFIIVISKDDNT